MLFWTLWGPPSTNHSGLATPAGRRSFGRREGCLDVSAGSEDGGDRKTSSPEIHDTRSWELLGTCAHTHKVTVTCTVST